MFQLLKKLNRDRSHRSAIDLRSDFQPHHGSQTTSSRDPPPPASVSFPDGIKVWYEPPSPNVDICFVHGLTGNRDSTWTASGQQEAWPKNFLPGKLVQARLMTWGYDAYILRLSTASQNTLLDHATNLLRDLTDQRFADDASSRPLIFVAHSLGGLVCKRALLLSRTNALPHFRNLFDCTTGILFMGTPHTGSWLAKWAKIPVKAFGVFKSLNTSLLEVLKTDNQLLEDLQRDFLNMVLGVGGASGQLKVSCFFEELDTFAVGKIVSKEAATFAGHDPASIHADHRGMVRFTSPEDTGFKRVLGELQRWTSKISTKDQNLVVLQTALDLFGVPRCDRALKAVGLLLNMKTMKGCKRDLDELCLGMDDAKQREARRNLIEAHYSSAVSRYLKSLGFGAMRNRELGIRREASGTCLWIYDDPSYQSWESQQTALLWIKGNPGSGKSTLIKSLYQHRQQISSQSEAILLKSFFNARGEVFEKTAIGLYRVLMHDILVKIPLLACELLPKFIEKEEMGSCDDVKWDKTELAEMFHDAISQNQLAGIEIFIDALDECDEEDVRYAIRGFEQSISHALEIGTSLKICWSSRYYPTISLRSEQGLEIHLGEKNKSDISRYVRQQFLTVSQVSLRKISEMLITKAKDIFLWAILVTEQILRAIDRGHDLHQLIKLLDSIPGELHQLFDRIFAGDNSIEERSQLGHLTGWIFCPNRQLSLKELKFALALHSVDSPLSLSTIDFDMQGEERFAKRVIDISGGLFESIVSPDNGLVVQVIHESVRDYLLSAQGLRLLGAISRRDFFLRSNRDMTITCFKALLTADFMSERQETALVKPKEFSETMRALGHPLAPLRKNSFLENYVHKFIFEHLYQADDVLASGWLMGFPLSSTDLRRRLLEHFLRLEFMLALSETRNFANLTSELNLKPLGPGIPQMFGFGLKENLELRRMAQNYHTWYGAFSISCQLEMVRPHIKLGPQYSVLALFYTCRISEYGSLTKPVHVISELNCKSGGKMTSLRFVFASSFKVADHDGEHVKQLEFFFKGKEQVRSFEQWQTFPIPYGALPRMYRGSSSTLESHQFASNLAAYQPHSMSNPPRLRRMPKFTTKRSRCGDLKITRDLSDWKEFQPYENCVMLSPAAPIDEYGADAMTIVWILRHPNERDKVRGPLVDSQGCLQPNLSIQVLMALGTTQPFAPEYRDLVSFGDRVGLRKEIWYETGS